MDLSRLVVLIWLYLPALVYIGYRLWYSNRTSKYTQAHTAQVTDASFSSGILGGAGSTNLNYSYRVMGVDYEGSAYLDGKVHQPGDDIPIRYNPSHPEQSILWKPSKSIDWLILGMMWLAFSLGSTIFFIIIGLIISLAPIVYNRLVGRQRKAPNLPLGVTIFMIVLGAVFVLAGIAMLVETGFWNQNLLLDLWNHRPLFSELHSLGSESPSGVEAGKLIDPFIVIEALLTLLLTAIAAWLLSILKKRMKHWLAYILVVIIFLVLVIAYVYVRIEYLEPMFYELR